MQPTLINKCNDSHNKAVKNETQLLLTAFSTKTLLPIIFCFSPLRNRSKSYFDIQVSDIHKKNSLNISDLKTKIITTNKTTTLTAALIITAK